MALFFWKREQEVEQLMDTYMDEVRKCLETFKTCLSALFEDSQSERAKALVQKVDNAESRADHIRSEIEYKLYSKALMPDSRGDLLGLIETVDRIPNWAEEMAYDIFLQRVVFPENLRGEFERIADMNIECFRVLNKAVSALFSDLEAVFAFTSEVDRIEGEIDNLEHELIKRVFDIEERLSYQNLLHRIVRGICDISDKAENVADRLDILAAKRRI